MKAVILAGGLGTRLAEETTLRPKPMVEIGGRPILWHIMKSYSFYGIKEFIVCCGYKGFMIKEYFANYFMHMSDVTYDVAKNSMEVHSKRSEPWKVTLIDTGDASMTGGRLLRVADYLRNEELFCLTYGDGVTDLNISDTIKFHRKHGKEATLTAAFPPARFGALKIEAGVVKSFEEKPRGDGGMINGGYFVLNPSVLRFLEDDFTVWEQEPLRRLARSNQLMAFEHTGFWQPMDTIRDKQVLEELWSSGSAPWKVWS
jgi:glucose-1-phosphate cytidylyltransferase